MSKSLDTADLADILPPSILIDATMQASGQAVDPELRRLAEALDIPVLLKRIDQLTSGQLDHLARQYDATWRDSWSLAVKRSVLKATIANKRRVGTIAAVKAALSAIASTARLIEWWQTEPKGDPHTFTITATASGVEGGVDADLQADIIAQIEAAKPVRSWYSLQIMESIRSGFCICGGLRTVTFARISHLE